MTWLKVDDGALTHPKTMHLRSLGDPIAKAETVVGFVMLAASWSGLHRTDCFISESACMFASPTDWQHLATFATKVGILTRATVAQRKAHAGQRGWMVKTGDGEIFHLLLKEQIEINREKRNFGRRLGPRSPRRPWPHLGPPRSRHPRRDRRCLPQVQLGKGQAHGR